MTQEQSIEFYLSAAFASKSNVSIGMPGVVRFKPTVTYLGLVGLTSTNNKYLQPYLPSGEMHASNSHCNTDETWLLYVVDRSKGWYALQNFTSQKFLTITPIDGNLCPRAISDTFDIWVLRKNSASKCFLRHKATGRLLKARGEGDDTPCGGEVDFSSNVGESFDATWTGWWDLQGVPVPTPGANFFNTPLGVFGSWAVGKFEDFFRAIKTINITFSSY